MNGLQTSSREDDIPGMPGLDPYASERDALLQAVRVHGSALQHASRALRHDRELVLQAVRSNGSALQYAPADFQADTDVVLHAVRWNDATALEFADGIV